MIEEIHLPCIDDNKVQILHTKAVESSYLTYFSMHVMAFPTRHNLRITRRIHVNFTTSSPRVIRELSASFYVYNDHLLSYVC